MLHLCMFKSLTVDLQFSSVPTTHNYEHASGLHLTIPEDGSYNGLDQDFKHDITILY